jgi:hypothetical protein
LLALALIGASRISGASAFLKFLVKISAKVASADIPNGDKGNIWVGVFQSISHVLGGYHDTIGGRHLRHR